MSCKTASSRPGFSQNIMQSGNTAKKISGNFFNDQDEGNFQPYFGFQEDQAGVTKERTNEDKREHHQQGDISPQKKETAYSKKRRTRQASNFKETKRQYSRTSAARVQSRGKGRGPARQPSRKLKRSNTGMRSSKDNTKKQNKRRKRGHFGRHQSVSDFRNPTFLTFTRICRGGI